MERASAGKLVKSKSNNSAITPKCTRSRGKKTSRSNVEFRRMESKKRGVYVEKWANSKENVAEDNRRQHRAKAQTRPDPKAQTATDDPKVSPITRVPGSHSPPLVPSYTKLQNPPLSKTAPGKVPKPNTLKNQPKYEYKHTRNIIQDNKKQVKKMKFRSNAVRELYANTHEKVITFKQRKEMKGTPSIPSNISKVTKDLSDHAHWSNIFPNDSQNNLAKQLVEKHIADYNQNISRNAVDSTPSVNKTDSTKGSGKDENIYKFFIDLLGTVYNEQAESFASNTLSIVPSEESSKINFEIEENVAQKLYTQQSEPNINNTSQAQNENETNQYTIVNDDELFNQSQQLAEYNNRAVIMQKPSRRRRKPKINFTYTHKTYSKADEKMKKPKKQNLLSLLKEKLAIDCYASEEPENMYQALSTIARNKRKYRQIRFDTPKKGAKSDYEVCRFKRRQVISPSTRHKRNRNRITRDYDLNNSTRSKCLSGSVGTASDIESNHSLEVFGFDYEDIGVSNYDEPESKYVRNITNLNQGLKTITQTWRQ